jgi:hypothetical protein
VVPGKLGSYGAPQFTSGTQQQFDIKNEGELYAKLPLGAAKLSGRVSAGEELSLTYFVTGVAMSSREALYIDELAAIPGCEGATHFVWAYNLGAFSLGTKENRAAEVEVGVGNAGGGARGSQEKASLSSGGSLAACSDQDQRGCRVPIRLALREIAHGQAPAAATAVVAEGGAAGGTQESQAQELWDHAKTLFDKGDGKGCVSHLEKALAADMRLMDRVDFQSDMAICTMRAGDCDKGKAAYRASLAKADTKREMQEFQLQRQVRKMSNNVCPSGTAKNDTDFIERAYREVKDAAKVDDAKTCKSLATAVAKHKASLRKNYKKDAPDWDLQDSASNLASNAILAAAQCAAKATKKCKAGLDLIKLECDALDKAFRDNCIKVAPQSWEATVKAAKIDCK